MLCNNNNKKLKIQFKRVFVDNKGNLMMKICMNNYAYLKTIKLTDTDKQQQQQQQQQKLK